MAFRKASAVIVAGLGLIAGLAVLGPSPAPVAGRAPMAEAEEESLRATAGRLLGTVAATPDGEIEAPQARLGRALFWDARLSANGKVACASCHTREGWGADSRRSSTDARGRASERQSPTVFHAMEANGLRWLGDRATGAAQALSSITGSMGFAKRADIVPALRRHGYEPAFRAAFPEAASDPLTPANYALALQAYQATLRTPAPFDRWLAGESGALDARAQRGLRRFVELGCAGCHNGPLLGGRMLERFGLAGDYWAETGSEKIDPGLMQVTRREEDRHVFRVPALRNIARTAPYFHDGTVAELGRAIRIMARLQLGQELEEAALDELVAFLEALTGAVPEHYAPPADLPLAPAVEAAGATAGPDRS